ncbi:1-acyl-sn-glycerol-3-phosphate acyltransferase [Streptomyces klenkii]|uniref:1-acyl-sn-glycerol-3-phosphate acyltransferase n=1 Tax=Streptomyces klenkii TaxID=1420899 RepID=A0A3B0AGS9_9ACTN|nr:lysophospholipid acyltransferase family protein [Streptomyces klenkii]RKN59708.1 1-acyl-sn-glycerol-3-phosphate acyltransferase [Streptomyces klenkii]
MTAPPPGTAAPSRAAPPSGAVPPSAAAAPSGAISPPGDAAPWRPVSSCDRGCLHPRPPTVGHLRRTLRIAAFLLLLAHLPLLALTRLAGHRVSDAAYRCYMRGILRSVGVRWTVTVHGAHAPTSPVAPLVVSNHTSWLDVTVLPAALPVRLVSRADLRRWPVIGWIAALGRSLYVDRDRLSTLPDSVARITAALRRGDAVAVFAEGTTWCGAAGGRYRPAVFQAALDAGAAVRPVALRYRIAGAPTTGASYVGPMSAAESLRNTAALRGLAVDVTFLPLIPPGTAPDRRSLAALAERAVDAHSPVALRCSRRHCSARHAGCTRCAGGPGENDPVVRAPMTNEMNETSETNDLKGRR